jgi:beta-glucosidase
VLYAPGCGVNDADESGMAEAVRLAQTADAIVLVLGDKSGLAPDCTTGEFRDGATLALPGRQQALAEAVMAAARPLGKPVIVVLINGRPLALPWLAEQAAAIVEAWLPGEEGAAAIAEVLFGDVAPGGKLPLSIPRSVGQLPVHYNYKPSGRRSNIYGPYVDQATSPLYPFGHGLSYTTFGYADLSIAKPQAAAGETVAISFRVTNTGRVAGDEVVQLYICDEYACVPRPVKELKGYRRLTLAPGQSRRVTFQLPVNQLAFYDADLALRLEPGRISVMVGSSSEDIRLTGEFAIAGAGATVLHERVYRCPVDVSD